MVPLSSRFVGADFQPSVCFMTSFVFLVLWLGAMFLSADNCWLNEACPNVIQKALVELQFWAGGRQAVRIWFPIPKVAVCNSLLFQIWLLVHYHELCLLYVHLVNLDNVNLQAVLVISQVCMNTCLMSGGCVLRSAGGIWWPQGK